MLNSLRLYCYYGTQQTPALLALRSGYLAQSPDSDLFSDIFNIPNLIRLAWNGRGMSDPVETVLYCIESTISLVFKLGRSRSPLDAIIYCMDYIRTITKQSITKSILQSSLMSRFKKLFSDFTFPEAIPMDSFRTQAPAISWLRFGIDSLDGILDNYQSVSSCDIVVRFKKFILYSLCLYSTETMKLQFSEKLFTRIERNQAIFNTEDKPMSMMLDVLRNFTYFLKHGLAVMETGDWSLMWLSSDKIAKLHNEYIFLMSNFTPFITGNLKECDTHSYMQRLDTNIEAIKRTINACKQSKLKSVDLSYLRKMHSELSAKQADIYTEQFARESRDPPFGICILGPPGVGKSSLIDVFGKCFASKKGKQYDNTIKYTKNPTANFWDGYRTSQWMIVLDDVGFLDPRKAPNGDPTLMEILQIHNTTAFVPDQASLDLKGKTPCRCELLVATSNTKDLNAEKYFQTPSAVLRRFDINIEVSVKPAFATEDGRLDHVRIKELNALRERDGLKPLSDIYWNVNVFRYLILPENRFERKVIFEGSIEDFLRHDDGMDKILDNHISALNLRKANEKIREKVCVCKHVLENGKFCNLLSNMCEHDYVEEVSDKDAEDEKPSFRRLKEIVSAHYEGFSSHVKKNVLAHFKTPDELNSVLESKGCKPITAFSSQAPELCDTDTEEFVDEEEMPVEFDRYDDYELEQLEKDFISKEKKLRNLKTQIYHTRNVHRVWPSLWQNHLDDLNERRIKCQHEIDTHIFRQYTVYKAVKDHRKSIVLKSAGVVAGVLSLVAAVTLAYKLYVSKSQAPKPIPSDSKVNPWKQQAEKVPYPAYMDTNTLSDRLSRNVGVIKIHVDDTKSEYIVVGALCVRGTYWVTTKHAFRRAKFISLVTQNNKQGVTSNTQPIRYVESQHIVDDSRDLIILNFVQSRPCRSLYHLLPKEDLFDINSDGRILFKEEDGSSRDIEVTDIRKCGRPHTYSQGVFSPSYSVGENDITYKGENFEGLCGFPIISEVDSLTRNRKASKKIIIAGIHTAGSYFSSLGRVISRDWLDATLPPLDEFCIQSASDDVEPIGYPEKEVALDDIHPKSPFNFLPSGQAELYGRLDYPRSTPRSSVGKTIMADSVVKHCGVEITHSAPDMTSWRPMYHAAKDLVNPVQHLDSSIIKLCAYTYFRDISDRIKNPSDIEKYDMDTIVNGAPGVKFVDKMNFKTSMGFPFRGPKSKFLHPHPYKPFTDFKVFDEKVLDMVVEYEENLAEGKRSGAVFTAHLKDEPRSLKKVAEGKTRVFTGANVAFTILLRKYFLSVTRLLQNNWQAYNGAVGVNCFSTEWGDFYNYLTVYGSDRIVAGDYKAFDKRMPPLIILWAFEILIHLNKELGDFSMTDIKIMRGLATDVAYPRVNFGGELVEFVGGNPSGHALTVVINSLANCLYMRYCFHVLAHEHKVPDICQQFSTYVNLLTYGDDNIMGVSPDVPFFNHSSISKVLSDVDITYTMAEKDQESVPYISINDASFLKRKWKMIGGLWACPLDETSIFRSLMLRLYDSSIGSRAHAKQVLDNACRELSLYGQEHYNQRIEQLKKVNSECKLRFEFYTWEEAFQKVYMSICDETALDDDELVEFFAQA
ncbi:hypothetical protein 1 [Wenzhou picorna-like virus 14]|uniref:hypothetical protein 1 n=1 Tax=Wenzhou picorna-like virus 14 TaxID=1923598 RepID=UPI00090B904F|nr:hypothetical protein 1 [Wenzhou picorna-like virus 14]APG78593.1 hypothetical protein 1 [Wenzhou picorna-like virus 14]